MPTVGRKLVLEERSYSSASHFAWCRKEKMIVYPGLMLAMGRDQEVRSDLCVLFGFYCLRREELSSQRDGSVWKKTQKYNTRCRTWKGKD